MISRFFAPAGVAFAVLTLHGCGGGGHKSHYDGTCDKKGKVKDCNHPDFGSCGNACCIVEISVDEDPSTAAGILKDSLGGGGADKGFSLPTTDAGGIGIEDVSANQNSFPSPYKESKGGVWVGQAHHVTSDSSSLEDSIYFSFRSGEKGGSVVRLNSISTTEGVFDDHGQNYKNILNILHNVSQWKDKSRQKLFGTCGGKKSTEAWTLSGVGGAEFLQHPKASSEVVRSLSALEPAYVAQPGRKGVPGSCHQTPGLANCDHPDFGSCGNACCALVLDVAVAPDEALRLLNQTVTGASEGGPDDGFNVPIGIDGDKAWEDLSEHRKSFPDPFKSSSRGPFIGQVRHIAAGPQRYEDALSFNLRDGKEGHTEIIAVSTSLTAGAFGDKGQNFKNIVMLAEFAFGIDSLVIKEHLFGSCPHASLEV